MPINVNKTKVVVFLEAPAMRQARPRFNFTLTPAFPVLLPEKTRIKVRQELRLHRHTTSAGMESVRIPRHSPGLIVETLGDDMAIVEVEGIGKVELRVQDLEHIRLVIDEVDCFKYLGLHLDYALRMEEATEAGVSNIHFAHSKVAATLHSLRQLPRRGNNAVLSPLMRLQMWPHLAVVVRTTTANVAGFGNSTAGTPTSQAAVSATLPIHIRIPFHSACTTIRPQDQKQKLRPT